MILDDDDDVMSVVAARKYQVTAAFQVCVIIAVALCMKLLLLQSWLAYQLLNQSCIFRVV